MSELFSEFFRRVRLFASREKRTRELEEEMRSHLAMRTDVNIGDGMAHADAASAARRRFGNAPLIAESSRDAWGGVWLEQRVQDLRIAARGLRRTPGFMIAAVLTLGLGIGASTSVFSVAYSILLAPLPMRDPSRVVVLWAHNPTNQPEHFPLSGEEYTAFAREARSFSRVGAVDYHGTLPRLMQFGDTMATVPGAMVVGDFFQALGARPLLGRLLGPEDDVFGAPFAVVLSEGLWRRAFGADPSVVGRTTKLYARNIVIVGVVAGDLDYPHGSELWGSLAALSQSKDTLFGFYDVVARLAPGATPANAAGELGAFLARPAEPHSGARQLVGNTLRAVARPFMDVLVGDVRPAIRVVGASVALLLLVTCVNIANLLLIRTMARGRELAVRAALGAGRARIAQQVFAESAVLAVLGGAVGVACAWYAVRAFVLLAPADVPRLGNVALNAPAVTAAVVLSVIVTLLFGGLPALASTRISLADSLRERRVGESSPSSHHTRALLVGVQVAVAVVALVAAAVVARGYEALAHVNLGFTPEKLIVARFGATGVPTPDFLNGTTASIERLRGVAGVTHATGLSWPPFQATGNDLAYTLPGDTPGAATSRPLADFLYVDGDYFQTLGIRLEKGRFLTTDDRAGSALSADVDELLAHQAWPGEDPIGKKIGIGTTYFTIVGVVAPTRYRDVLAPRASLYVTYSQWGTAPGYVAIRTTGNPAALTASLRAAVHAVDPRFYITDFTTLSGRVDATMAQSRLDALLLVGFAVAILLLTGVGLYSVAATFVRQREFEIGLRIALGAAPAQVVRLVLRQGGAVIVAGAAAGVVGAIAGAAALRSIVYAVSVRDPLSYAAAICAIGIVAGLAFALPARRAARANPADVLRAG